MIKGQTFANQKIRAEDQAIINSFTMIQDNGVFKGIATEVSITNNGGLFTLGAGKILCQGRVIDIEQNTQITIPLAASSSIVKGYLILKIDLSKEPPDIDSEDYNGTTEQCFITYKEGTADGDFPQLVQNNLLDNGSIYELPLMSYFKTNTGFSNVTRVIKLIGKNNYQDNCVEKAITAYNAPNLAPTDSSIKIANTAFVHDHVDYTWKDVQKTKLTSNLKDWQVEHDFDFNTYDYKIRIFLKYSGASSSVAAHMYFINSSNQRVGGSYGIIRKVYHDGNNLLSETGVSGSGQISEVQTSTSDGTACIELNISYESNTDTLFVVTDAISNQANNSGNSGCNSMCKMMLTGPTSKTPTKIQVYSYSPTWYANSTIIISRKKKL